MNTPSRCPTCGSPDPQRHPIVGGALQVCADSWHTPQSAIEETPISAAEVGLAKIIAFLLHKFCPGDTITIPDTEWEEFLKTHGEAFLKSELDPEKKTMTIAAVSGEEAAGMRTLLTTPSHGRVN